MDHFGIYLFIIVLGLPLLQFSHSLPSKSPAIILHRPTPVPTFHPTSIPTTSVSVNDPTVISYGINLNYGNFSLQFDRDVNTVTFNVQAITFILKSSNSSHKFFVSRSFNLVELQGNSSIVNVFFTHNDYVRFLYENYQIKENFLDYLFTCSRGLVMSSEGFTNSEVNITNALSIGTFVNDSTSPYILNFSIDMNYGILSLSFSEPVDTSTFSLNGIILQSHKNSVINPVFVSLETFDYITVNVSNYNTDLSVLLDNSNLNNIKAASVCNSKTNCFVSVQASFVSDLNGNYLSLVGVDRSVGIPVHGYLPDITPPYLKAWELDINSGEMIIIFSETIDLSYFNYSAIRIVNSSSLGNTSVEIYHFRNPEKSKIEIENYNKKVLNETIRYIFSTFELNELKSKPHLCKRGTVDCFLTLELGAVADTSLSRNIYQGVDATSINPRAVSSFIADNIRPQLINFIFNLTSRDIILIFSETVKLSSINIVALSIQSDRDLSVSSEYISRFSLSQTSCSRECSEIVLKLFNSDYDKLRTKYEYLGKSESSTYISITDGFVTDDSYIPNRVIAIPKSNALKVDIFVPDLNPPSLLSWTFNLTNFMINLSFSGPIDRSTISLKDVKLLNSPFYTSSYVLNLTEQCRVLVEGSIASIYLEPLLIEYLQIDNNQLCHNPSNCYLLIPESFAKGIVSFSTKGKIQLNVVAQIKKVSLLISKKIAAELKAFGVDFNQYIITLQFNRVVDPNSLNVTSLTFYANQDNSSYLKLTSYLSYPLTESPSSIIEILMNSYDVDRIIQRYPLYSSLNTSFLSIKPDSIMDLSGNSLSTNIDQRFVASTYIGFPQRAPSLLAVYLNFSSLTLYLKFDTPIDHNFIDLSTIVLTSTNNAKISLREAIIYNPKNSSLVLIDLTDLEVALRNSSVAQSQATTFVYIQSTLSNQRLSATPQAIRDGNRVLTFILDMSSKPCIILLMAIPLPSINVKISISSFTLKSVVHVSMVTLSGYNNYEIIDAIGIRIFLADIDILRIQEIIYPIFQSDDIILTLDDTNAIVDSNKKSLSSTPQLVCNRYFPDKSFPEVVSFSINLQTAIINLSFSKVIRIDTIDLTKLFISSSPNASNYNSNVLSLQNSKVINPNNMTFSTEINLSIDSTDSEINTSISVQIQLSNTIATSLSNTYLLVEDDFIGDTSFPSNYLTNSESNTSSIQATSVIVDLTLPKLISFSFNRNANTIVLVFDKPMLYDSNRPSKYYLLSGPSTISSYISYQLQNSTTLFFNNSVVGYIVTILLGEIDIDSIDNLAPSLCTSLSNCYLSLRGNAIYAVNRMGILQIPFRHPIQIQQIIPDSTPPQVLSSTLDLNSAYLDLYFDKRINCRRSNPQYIIIQSGRFVGKNGAQCKNTCAYQLQTSSQYNCSSKYPKSIRVFLSLTDTWTLKSLISVAKSLDTSFLRFITDHSIKPFVSAFMDVSDNKITEIMDGKALQVSTYIPDSTPPKLQSFSISKYGKLKLFFSEPMRFSSLNNLLGKLTLQNHANFPTITIPLKSIVFLSSDSLWKTITFNIKSDFDFIGRSTNLFTSQSFIYLSFTQSQDSSSSTWVTDVAGNGLSNILPSSALQIGPALLNWAIDLNAREVSFFFSESVFGGFSVVGINIEFLDLYHSNVSILNYTFDSRYLSYRVSDNQQRHVFVLGEMDIDKLKIFSCLAYPAQLSTPKQLTVSTATDSIIPSLGSIAIVNLPISSFVPNNKPPDLILATINISSATLHLTFDEPVNLISINGMHIQLVAKNGLIMPLFNASTIIIKNESNLHTKFTLIFTTREDIITLKKAFAEYVYILAESVSDFCGNMNVNVLSSQITYVSVTKPPSLLSLEVNRNKEKLVLVFDEVIDCSTSSTWNFSLGSSLFFNESIEELYSVLEYSDLSEDTFTGAITIDLSIKGKEFIESLGYLTATNINNSFLSIVGVCDIFGNCLPQYPVPTFQATSFIADSSNFELISFDYVAAEGTGVAIILYFSKPLSISTFNCSILGFQSNPSLSSNIERTFLPADNCTLVTMVDSVVIELYFDGSITIADQDSSSSSTSEVYCSVIGAQNVKDVYGFRLQDISTNNSIRSGPRLLRWEADLSNYNNAMLSIEFSKSINITSSFFNSSALGFFGLTDNVVYLSFTSPTLIKPRFKSTVFSISLSVYDFNRLVYLSYSFYPETINENIHLIVLENCLYDEYGQSLVPISKQNSLNAFKWDQVSYEVIVKYATLDVSNNQLTIRTYFPIQLESLYKISFLLDIVNISIESFVIEGPYVSNQSRVLVPLLIDNFEVNNDITADNYNGYFNITMNLSSNSSEAVKLTGIGVEDTKSTAYISFTYNAYLNNSTNPVNSPHYPTTAWQINRVIPDNQSPVLQSFVLDMNLGHLILRFNEPISISSLNPTGITLQSRYRRQNGVSYSLTGGEAFYINSSAIFLVMTVDDVNGIKSSSGLARNRASTFLTCLSMTISDISFNSLVPIIDGKALLCNSLIVDSTPPLITSSSLDLTLNTLTLYMSEPVLVSSLNPEAFTFVLSTSNTALESTSMVTLSSLSVTSNTGEISIVLIIHIAEQDIIQIKRHFPLCSNLSTSTYVYSSSLIFDTYRNPIVASNTLQSISTYVVDVVPPKLLSYSLDMTLGIINVIFSEAVDISVTNLSALTFQSKATARFGSIVGLSGLIRDVGSSVALYEISIDSNILNGMKNSSIGRLTSSTYLSWTSNLVSDFAGNSLLPRYDASVLGYSPLQPVTLLADSVNPLLIRWYIDVSNDELILIFNEPVRLASTRSLSVNSVTLLSNLSITYEMNSTFVAVSLSIKGACLINYKEAKILSVESNSVFDFAATPNPLLPIVDFPISGPVCGNCSNDQYISQPCDQRYDRVCSPCSLCSVGTFTLGKCRGNQDTECSMCSNCLMGSYIAQRCTSKSDTLCKPCKKCSPLQYYLRHCESGHDAVCGSCEKCEFLDQNVKAECIANGKWEEWSFANCCKDNSGQKYWAKVPCNEVAQANIRISLKKNHVKLPT